MSADHVIPDLDRAGLRRFGLSTGTVLALLFGLLVPWLIGRPIPIWPWAVGGALVAFAMVAPTMLRPVYRVWMRFGLLAGRITTPLVLGLVFYAFLTPMAAVKRLLGKDAMRRRLDRGGTDSYRSPSQPSPKERLERPF